MWWPLSSKKRQDAANAARKARCDEINANFKALGIDATLHPNSKVSEFINAMEEIALMATRAERRRAWAREKMTGG